MTDAMPDTALSHRQDINITQLPIIPIVQRPSHTNKNCLLSEGERLAIEPFKERYKSEAQQKKGLHWLGVKSSLRISTIWTVKTRVPKRRKS
jgi:hypothetical protein